MTNVPSSARGKANEAAAASAPKRPWTKPAIRTLKVISTYSGSRTGLDEDSGIFGRPRYTPSG